MLSSFLESSEKQVGINIEVGREKKVQENFPKTIPHGRV